MRLPDRGHRHPAIVSNGITSRYPSAGKPTPVIRYARSRRPRFSGYAGQDIVCEAGSDARIVINRPELRNAFDPKLLNNRCRANLREEALQRKPRLKKNATELRVR